jgi:hypothetical protein
MTGKPITRGGKRPNAGRKKGGTGRKAITVQVSLVPPLVEAIDEVRGKQTRAAWIRDRLKFTYL